MTTNTTNTKTMQQTYVERMREKADSLNAMADWLDRLSTRVAFADDTAFLDLMTPYTYVSDLSVDLTVKWPSVYNEDTKQYDYPIDEEATALNVKKFKKACGGFIKKEYDGVSVEYRKVFADFTLVGRVDREAVCKPTKVERVWQEESTYTTPGRWVETVKEWDCLPDDDTE